MTVGKAKLGSKAVDAPLGWPCHLKKFFLKHFFFKLYAFMAALGLPLLPGLSPVETGGGRPLDVVPGLLTALASLLAEQGP